MQGPPGAVLVVDGGVVIGPSGASVVVTPLTSGDAACANGGVRITQLSDGGITHVCNGAPGAQGPQGVQGLQGAPGASVTATELPPLSAQCATGGVLLGFADGGSTAVCNGAQGAQGVQGGVGPAGPQGLQGEQGLQGVPGVTGPQGLQGEQGLQGVPGAVGPQGGIGPMGPAGPQGASLTATALPAMSAQCVTGGVLIGYPDGGSAAVCNGAQGLQGAQGVPGATGPQGLQGEQGLQGAQGAPGATGAQGPQGPQGPAGPAGVSVTASVLPNLSAQCLAGGVLLGFADGGALAVCNGAQGPQGAQGVQGLTGAQGTPGPQGNPGPAGAAGPQGPMGPSGPAGPAGEVRFLDGGVIAQDWVQFVGFTTLTFNGNLGGITGANQKCDAQYPGSYLCTESDYWRTEPNVYPPSTGAWLDFNRDARGTRSTGACYVTNGGAWLEATSADTGRSVNALGNAFNAACDAVKPLACCKSPRKRTFRGFTTLVFNGNLGGTVGANQKCNAAYPGSFLCTLGDFGNAETTASPGGVAAWLDFDRDSVTGDRSTGACYVTNVGAWTESTSADTAPTVSQYGGTFTAPCNTERPLACCQ